MRIRITLDDKVVTEALPAKWTSSVVNPRDARARAVEFAPGALVVHLEDGRSLQVPLDWFPRLRNATADQRAAWKLLGGGSAIHWPAIDEDVSVSGLLGLPD